MSDDIVFEEPPPRPKGGSRATVAKRLEPLRGNPGQWARVYGPTTTRDQAGGWANALQRGAFVGIEPGEYETTSRMIDGQGFVWARYVGNGADS